MKDQAWIENRIKELEAQAEQHKLNNVACNGAIGELTAFIKR